VEEFEEFFGRATGVSPYGYQSRLARDGLPAVVQAPTGAGKTGIVLAWLWRRLNERHRDSTPRRLVYALPQRSLVEQVAAQAKRWLANLGLAERVALHVVMGGEGKTQRQWRLDMHQPAIVIGTVDSLVSKALNRGYGIGRALYPIDFALVTNGAHWVVDEIQLCPESTATLRQLAAFTTSLRTAEPFGLTCMSATVPEDLLGTVDNPVVDDSQVVRIRPEERTGELAIRLQGKRTVRKLDAAAGDYAAIASAIQERHRPGTLTLAVVNTVEAARQVFKGLNRGADCTLLHSRFRAVEREALIDRITATPGSKGHIVIATQVVEAGIDLNAEVMFTEAAPWPSIVQRAGRCNRTGRVADAELWWLPPAKPFPYPAADVEATAAELASLEGAQVTGEDLLGRAVPVTEAAVSVLRRSDLIALFDTAPDLSGADVDVAPYVRDAEDMDAQLAWATWKPASLDGRPPDDARAPLPQWRCRVPLRDLPALQRRTDVWRLDQSLGRWTRVTAADRARPGEVLVVAAEAGGYDPVTGFEPAASGAVPGCPEMRSRADLAAGLEETFREDSTSTALTWLSLDQHSLDVRDEAARLLADLLPAIPQEAAGAVVVAAYAHDIGKAHPVWQDALCKLASEQDSDWVGKGRPWAKSASSEPLRFAGNAGFRHELASVLLLDGPLNSLLTGVDDPDLTRYLVLAHHGKVRVQVRAPDEADPEVLAGLRHGDACGIPPMLGHPPSELRVDLKQFGLGGERSWTRTALGLRDRYGPFVLAYLETVVRIADWRASRHPKEADR
jgi:CRISPR-associated endonuclease/helicase Cas3